MLVTDMRKRPELLAPAGDMERLKMAVLYGADAVYLASDMFGTNIDITIVITIAKQITPILFLVFFILSSPFYTKVFTLSIVFLVTIVKYETISYHT